MERRGFLACLLAAPAVIRTPGLLMPVRPLARRSILVLETWQWPVTPLANILTEYFANYDHKMLHGDGSGRPGGLFGPYVPLDGGEAVLPLHWKGLTT